MSSISSIGFSAGGIDVNSIVTGLMTAERTPERALAGKQAAATLQSQAVAKLRASLQSLQSQAATIVSNGMSKLSSSVSNPTVATASASPTASPGSLSFTVDGLASTSGVRTANAVAASTSVVTSAASLAVSSTVGRLGISTVGVGAGTTTGQYTVTVTQATAGAKRSGSAALGPTTTIDGTNNTLDLQIDGVAKSITIASGTYTASALATQVQAALDSSGAAAKASIDGTGTLTIATTHEGSTALLQVGGGSSLAALKLSAGSSIGVDGAVQIGSNPSVAVTSAGTGSTATVLTGSGTLNLTLSGGLRVGEATVAVVSTGDRSLGAVASAINAANVGVSAAAVKVSDGAWLLQVNSTRTGVANSVSLDGSVFTGTGGVLQASAGQDAKITIGTGAGAYSVRSSSNSYTDVLPGVTVNVSTQSAAPVTVTVGRDSGATADAVGALVTAASSLLADIAAQVKYDPKTNKASPLSGDSTVRQMADQIRSAVTSMVGTGSMALAGNAGITIKQDGSLAFDRAKFITALESDPVGVERLFARGGTSVGGASWSASTDKTVAGSYAINITSAATRATTGNVLVGGSTTGQTISVRVGTTTATYVAAAGAAAADIAAGLNGAFATAGLKVNAEVNGGGVRLTAVGFGGAGTFDTNLDVGGPGSAWTTNAGTDVVGTIDGKPAIGVGNHLSLLDGDTSPARGLGVDIAEGVSGAVGSITYQPGIAARLTALATTLTGTNGGLTTSASTYDSRITAYNKQIDDFETRMIAKETQYRRQWTAVQQSLASLQNQGSWLSSQVNGLSGSNG
jgi:flagellar hook-associated protein 2